MVLGAHGTGRLRAAAAEPPGRPPCFLVLTVSCAESTVQRLTERGSPLIRILLAQTTRAPASGCSCTALQGLPPASLPISLDSAGRRKPTPKQGAGNRTSRCSVSLAWGDAQRARLGLPQAALPALTERPKPQVQDVAGVNGRGSTWPAAAVTSRPPWCYSPPTAMRGT